MEAPDPHRQRTIEWIESGLLNLSQEQIEKMLAAADMLDQLEPVMQTIKDAEAGLPPEVKELLKSRGLKLS
jgi:hypothetical protein